MLVCGLNETQVKRYGVSSLRKCFANLAKIFGCSDTLVQEIGRWGGADIRELQISKAMIDQWCAVGEARHRVPEGYCEQGAAVTVTAMIQSMMRKLGARVSELGGTETLAMEGAEARAQLLRTEWAQVREWVQVLNR